jgi:hypothetical protein
MLVVIIAIVVVLLAAVGLFLFVNRVTGAEDDNVSDAQTPAGDTNQLSDAHGAEGGAVASHDAPDVARPVVGGEAEGERSTR